MSVHMRCQLEKTLGLLHLQAGARPVLVLALVGDEGWVCGFCDLLLSGL